MNAPLETLLLSSSKVVFGLMGVLISSTTVCLVLYFLTHGLQITHGIGHAGAVVQARQLGDELYCGVHSDEAILENKGPTVMTLRERYGNSYPFLRPNH